MKIICVDDEPLVLDLTAAMCRELPQRPKVTGFLRPAEAIEWLRTNTADVALLDVNMPGMDGITLAARVKQLRPEISIIFLTGYTQYAVDAFRLHVSGYLLKPVSHERLREEINYAMRDKIAAVGEDDPKEHIFIRTFGEFDIFVDGEIVRFPRIKAKELLAYLVDRQGGNIPRAAAFSVLWGDTPYDRARQKQFDVIIRSLRTTLEEYGIPEIFEMEKGCIRVNPEKFSCDMYRFFEGDVDAINTYRGEYMSAYSWASFTEAHMERE